MKRWICILLALMLAVSALTACSKKNEVSSADGEQVSSGPAVQPAASLEAQLCIDLENTVMEAALMDRLEEWGSVDMDDILRSVETWPQGASGVVITDRVTSLQDSVSVIYVDMDVPQSGNTTGVSSAVTLNDLIDLALESDPALKSVGVLYSADNEASAAQVQAAQSHCTEKGVTLEQVTVNSADEVAQSAAELSARADALLTPRDTKLFTGQAAAAIAQAAAAESIPWYAQDADMVQQGAVASVGPDYEAMGRAAADMCVELLLGQSVGQVSARRLEDKKFTVNQQTLNTLEGIKLSQEIMEVAELIGQ